ncbi:MAG TPA: alanyl-tRNA editing protein, partial [Blastocatellia bacterium]|nr:alanyl-tRNA editing protein [Blastocatellia bacterium]
MTEKLYWRQPHLTRFSALVEASRLENGQRILTLNQTAFYPTSGGQPCDLGRIGAANVVDVEITDDGRIHHKLATDEEFAVGAQITGEIDWSRRREMMQQHTGQHILSQAFFQLFGAETRGFRI